MMAVVGNNKQGTFGNQMAQFVLELDPMRERVLADVSAITCINNITWFTYLFVSHIVTTATRESHRRN